MHPDQALLTTSALFLEAAFLTFSTPETLPDSPPPADDDLAAQVRRTQAEARAVHQDARAAGARAQALRRWGAQRRAQRHGGAPCGRA